MFNDINFGINDKQMLYFISYSNKGTPHIIQEIGYEAIRVHRTYVLRSYQCFSIMIFFINSGRQNKISNSNQLMRPQPWVPGIKNRQEKAILKEK